MHEPEFLLFASNATMVGLAGGGLLLLAMVAFLGEWRRQRRKHVDAVGWMPWNTLSVLATFAGLNLLAMAVIGWLRG